MQNLALFEQTQGTEELSRIRSHSRDVQTHILAVLLEHLAQVHAQRLEHQTQVLLVVETRQQSQAVEFVLWIGIVQFAKELQLFQTTLVPKNQIKSTNLEINTSRFIDKLGLFT